MRWLRTGSCLVVTAAVTTLVLLGDPRLVDVGSIYVLATVAGAVVALVLPGAGAVLAASFLVATVVAPRMVFTPYPVTLFETENGKYLGAAAFVLLGFELARRGTDRRVVLVPAVLVALGVAVQPLLLLDASTAYLACGGALWSAGCSLARSPRLSVTTATAALTLAVYSIWRGVPGLGAEIGALPGDERPFGTLGNPLVAAVALWLLAAALVALVWPRRVVAALVVAAALFGITLTGSRTGLVLVAFTAGCAALGMYPRRAPSRTTGVRFVAAVAGGGLVLGAYLVFRGSLGRAGTVTTGDYSGSARLEALRQGLGGVVASPLGGGQAEINIAGRVLLTTYENVFFDVGARFGWLPLAAVVATLVLVWNRSSPPGRVALLLVVLAGLTSAVYYQPSNYLLGLLCAGLVASVTARPSDHGGRTGPASRSSAATAPAAR